MTDGATAPNSQGRIQMEARSATSLHLRPHTTLLAAAVMIALVGAMLLAGTARAATFTLLAELTAEEEVPTPGPEGATGFAVVTIDDDTNEVCFDLSIDGIGAEDFVTAAHIHVGAAGTAGGIVVGFFDEPPTAEMTGCVQAVDPEVVAAILANPAGYYVNIHTDQFPAGAVRGQLFLDDTTVADCSITVTPSTVTVGQQFVVSGNFDRAHIFLVEGADNPPAEDATPVHIVPEGAEFNVTFTAEADDVGVWTVWAVIPETECGDSALLTVVAPLPDAAAAPVAPALPIAIAVLLFTAAILTLPRVTVRR
jgi:hypothetical protein